MDSTEGARGTKSPKVRGAPTATASRLVRRTYESIAFPTGALAVILLAWYVAIAVTRVPQFILPTPEGVLNAFRSENQLLMRHSLVTLQELSIGLALGVLVGVVGAIAIVWSRTVDIVATPWIVLLQNVPKIVIAPLFVLWFGFGMEPKVIVVVLLVFFPILVSMVGGLRSVEPEMLELTRSMEASKWQVFYKARLPTSLPYFFAGLKVAVSFAVLGAIVGEWMGAEEGLGFLLIRAQDTFEIGTLFAALIVVAALSVALYQLVVVVERLALPWHASMRSLLP